MCKMSKIVCRVSWRVSSKVHSGGDSSVAMAMGMAGAEYIYTLGDEDGVVLQCGWQVSSICYTVRCRYHQRSMSNTMTYRAGTMPWCCEEDRGSRVPVYTGLVSLYEAASFPVLCTTGAWEWYGRYGPPASPRQRHLCVC